MMQDMNIRLYKAEDKLTEALNDLASTKHELAETKTKLMTTENELAKKDNELESEITRMRNPPYMHACGYKSWATIQSATIQYDTLLYSSTNTEGGGLDIA